MLENSKIDLSILQIVRYKTIFFWTPFKCCVINLRQIYNLEKRTLLYTFHYKWFIIRISINMKLCWIRIVTVNNWFCNLIQNLWKHIFRLHVTYSWLLGIHQTGFEFLHSNWIEITSLCTVKMFMTMIFAIKTSLYTNYIQIIITT